MSINKGVFYVGYFCYYNLQVNNLKSLIMFISPNKRCVSKYLPLFFIYLFFVFLLNFTNLINYFLSFITKIIN